MNDRGRILVTEYCGKILVCHIVLNRLDRVFLEDPASAGLPVGTIAIGKVKKMVPGIRAAFVTLGTDIEYFMQLPSPDDSDIYLVNRAYDGTIKCEDELVVQIKKQAVKTKQPIADVHPALTGRYAVMQSGRKGFHISSKLSRKQKEELQVLEDSVCEHEIIIRTNAASVSTEEVRRDIRMLKEQWKRLQDTYKHRTCYSILHNALPEYLTVIRDIPSDSYDEIVTDSISLQESIRKAFSVPMNDTPDVVPEQPTLPPIRLYEDASYPLVKLYSIETALHELMQKKVWLKSGGFLIFDETETLTAIDVNTGKNDKKKELSYAVNMEAVPEICRQLRARNISGMILIDFINMKHKEQTEALISALKTELKKDYVKANFIDVTGLGLFEVTREKRLASLKEMV